MTTCRPDYWEGIPSKHGKMFVFKGLELEYAPIACQHSGKIILGEEEVLFVFNHPRRYRLSMAEVNPQIRRISPDLPIQALEITEQGNYTPLYDPPEIPRPKLASDDAHSFGQCGKAWIVAQSPRDRDGILRATRVGNFRTGFK